MHGQQKVKKKKWHQVGLLFFNYYNDARSNKHKCKQSMTTVFGYLYVKYTPVSGLKFIKKYFPCWTWSQNFPADTILCFWKNTTAM